MDWKYLYTSFDGRLNRKRYWLGNIMLILAGMVLQTIIIRTLGFAAALIFSLIWLFPAFSLNVKRGHDRNRPAWLMAAFFALLVAVILMQVFGLDQIDDEPTTAFLIVGIPWLLLGLFFFVDLGFLRGTSGQNRYGADPLG